MHADRNYLICQQNNVNQNNQTINEYISQEIKKNTLLVYSKFFNTKVRTQLHIKTAKKLLRI